MISLPQRSVRIAAAEMDGPVYLRFTRDAIPVIYDEHEAFEIGKANVLREGTDAAVFACGLMVSETLAAARLLEAQGIRIAVINVHTIKPIDAACVTQWAEKCGRRGRRAHGQGQLQVPQDRRQRSVRPVRQGCRRSAGVWTHRRPDRRPHPGDSVTSFDAKIGRNRLISPDFSVLI